MSLIISIILLILSLAWIAALVSVVIPLKFLGYKNRKEAFQGFIGVTIIIFGIAIWQSFNEESEVADTTQKTEEMIASSSNEEPKTVIAQDERPPELPKTEDAKTAEANDTGTETEVAVTAPVVPYPEAQRIFTQTVLSFIKRYQDAETDFQRGSLRPARKDAICGSLASRNIEDWYGYVKSISTNSDGFGIVEIELAEDILIATWNNSLSDLESNTLISPDSSLYQQLGSIPEQSLVKFSGRFFRSKTDCIEEKSFTLDGSLSEPEFVLKFSTIEFVADAPPKKRRSWLKSILE